jgi:hypothetical protein
MDPPSVVFFNYQSGFELRGLVWPSTRVTGVDLAYG